MKKTTIMILIGVIIIAIGIVLYNYAKIDYITTDKFTICKINNSIGKEITDYKENKMPFIIEADEKVKITINGIEYKHGERIYKPGEYKVKVYNKEKAETSIINIKNIEGSKKTDYNIYSTVATLPTLFTSMNIIQNPEQKGYYWTKRTSTIDIEKLKKYCPNLEISKNIELKTDTRYEKILNNEMKEYIQKILEKDDNAYFNLHIDDFRFFEEFSLFAELGLTENRYKIYLYTDGTLSYNRVYEIREEFQYNNFKNQEKNYMELLDEIRSNKNSQENKNDIAYYLKDSEFYVDSLYKENDYNYNYLLISTLRNNVNYIVQYPDLITFKDNRISKEMQKANFIKIVAQEKFNEISENGRKIFFDLISFNKQEMDEKYFNMKENGKYLVITGTNPFFGIYKQWKFEELIQTVCEKYQDKYTILYKPHPSALPNEEQEKYLNSKNIKVLPGRIPMEAISYIYPNLKLGGYASSLYMSVDEGKTLFFFARDKESLVDPLNVLYDNLFSDAEFIN